MSRRCLWAGLGSSALVFAVAAVTPIDAATTLADWKFAEASSGHVDPDFGVRNDFNPVPGAPQNPTFDSAGNASRDLARVRGDIGTLNFRNQAAYIDLSTTVAGIGYTAPASYHKPYASDNCALHIGHDGNDVLSTRDPDAFLYSEMSAGFTLELIWRPTINQFGMIQPTTGEFTDNKNGVLMGIENFVVVGVHDQDPTSGVVDPVLYFYTNATLGPPTLVVPFDPAKFVNSGGLFEHLVAVYDPTLSNQLLLYRDGVLVGTESATLSNFDANNGGAILGRLSTVGGLASGTVNEADALFDQVRVTAGALHRSDHAQWLIALPEPGCGLLLTAGLAMILPRRNRAANAD